MNNGRGVSWTESFLARVASAGRGELVLDISGSVGSAQREEDTLDPSHGLVRVPETGELIAKEPPRRRRR